MLRGLKEDNRRSRDLAMLPMMPNFRTTCRIDGDCTLLESDRGVCEVPVGELQRRLEQEDHIMIHFSDEWMPEDRNAIKKSSDEGHL